MIVCPTEQSPPFIPFHCEPTAAEGATASIRDIDDVVRDTAKPQDVVLSNSSDYGHRDRGRHRNIKGSTERSGIPLALAALKLPTGAITAFPGLCSCAATSSPA